MNEKELLLQIKTIKMKLKSYEIGLMREINYYSKIIKENEKLLETYEKKLKGDK